MPPRPVLPRQFYLITRRCTQRQLLLRPDRDTREALTDVSFLTPARHGLSGVKACPV